MQVETGQSMLPKISIIIPVKPGGEVKALEPLRQVEYPADSFEVLVAEGRRPSSQRNKAAAEASGELLYFLDDDSLVDPGFLRRVIDHFSDPQVAVAGGPSLTPSSDSLRQRAFGAALSSPFGGGGVRNRYRKTGTIRQTGDHELILCNLCIRREVFLQFGGLDERLYPNEENELLDRLRKAGLKCIHDPDLAVTRSQRPTFRAFARQLFTYGRGRGEQTRIARRIPLPLLLPPLFFIYVLLLPFGDKPVYSLPLLCYGLLVLWFAASDARRCRDLKLLPLLLPVFPLLHLAYGSGLILGLVRPRFGDEEMRR